MPPARSFQMSAPQGTPGLWGPQELQALQTQGSAGECLILGSLILLPGKPWERGREGSGGGLCLSQESEHSPEGMKSVCPCLTVHL